jgi:hypothetical protein
MLERVDGADTKVTYLVKFSTSQKLLNCMATDGSKITYKSRMMIFRT